MTQDSENRKQAVWNRQPLEGVDRVIAIASGKGGVGKSTLTVMLAHAMAAQGRHVGILDADIYGPSIPRMLGLSGKPEIKNDKMIPLEAVFSLNGGLNPHRFAPLAATRLASLDNHANSFYSIACNSMGFLLDESQAAIWRGPMITKALYQLARLTDWATINHQPSTLTLLVDMPPGTGDIHLSMVQQIPLTGAVLVTTPQEVAVQDAIKCADMFRKVNVPVLGVIENMSWLDLPGGQRMEPFGAGGGAKLASACGAPLLAKLPLIPELTQLLDQGKQPTAEMLGYVPMI